MSMVQKDYLMRLIEQLGSVTAAMLRLKRSGEHYEVIQVAHEAVKVLLGLDLDEIESMRTEDLIGLVRLARSGYSSQLAVGTELVVIATLLQEVADAYAISSDPQRGDACRLKALDLYITVVTEEDDDLPQSAIGVESLLDHFTNYKLPATTVERLWRYHEQMHQFARAEDRLFELLDDCEDDQDLIERGVAFYTRLSVRSNTELQNGGLPRDEVLAGLDELQRMRSR